MFFEGGIIQKIFGNGIHSIRETQLGESAFTSYLNLLAEMGLFAFLPFITVIFAPILRITLIPKKLTPIFKNTYSVLVLAIFIAISHLFYRFETHELLWLFSGYVYGKSKTNRFYYE